MSQSRGLLEEYNSTIITKGLKAAIADSSISKPISSFDDAHIKLNKLMYAAAAELGILDQLQHSWHIYGSDLGDLVPPTQTVRPIALEELPRTESPEGPRIDESEDGLYTEEDVYEVFQTISIGELDSLEEILHADRITLLEQFYDEFSMDIEPFYDLYMFNLEIQRMLENHQEDIDVDSIGEEEYEQVNRLTHEMRKEFYSHEEFQPEQIQDLDVDLQNNIAEMFSDFLELLDDIYFYLSRKSEADLEGDPSHVISELKSFYLNQAWKAVTEIISFHTIRGPRPGGLEYGAKRAIREVDYSYHVKFDSLVSEARSAKILPNGPGGGQTDLLSPDETVELLEQGSLVND